MNKTPKGMRLHIGIFGRRNVGKSSLLNRLTSQDVSIVSSVPGTTTDPVEKAMELLPIGPVLFIDTAGIDDAGSLGEQRNDRTRRMYERTDLALIVAECGEWGEFEEDLLSEFRSRKTPAAVVFTKSDLCDPDPKRMSALEEDSVEFIVCDPRSSDTACLKEMIIKVLPDEFMQQRPVVGDLINAGDLVLLVVPIDLEAPRGRLILPQVQTIRDLLDHDACCAIVKERELKAMLDNLKKPPALVVCDSQAFLKVAADTPDDVPMTSFSILFARLKGDLETFAEGAFAIDRLAAGSKILIAEGCTHHPMGEDIGRVKIPRWISQYAGGNLEFEHKSGHDFPSSIDKYDLVIHCGSCTFNRRELLNRILKCRSAGVAITNYGMTLAFTLGILERALAPFDELSRFFPDAAKSSEVRDVMNKLVP